MDSTASALAPGLLPGPLAAFTAATFTAALPPPPPPAPMPTRPIATVGARVLALAGEPMRWRILEHLLTQGPSHAAALSRLVRRRSTTVSRHLLALRAARMIETVPSQTGDRRELVYDIPAQWRVAGDPQALDFGSALLRFSL